MISDRDRRYFLRMKIETDVTLYLLEEKYAQYQGICRDLSAQGMAIELDDPLEIGMLVKINVESKTGTVTALNTIAKVVRCKQNEDESYLLGVEFIEVN